MSYFPKVMPKNVKTHLFHISHSTRALLAYSKCSITTYLVIGLGVYIVFKNIKSYGTQ